LAFPRKSFVLIALAFIVIGYSASFISGVPAIASEPDFPLEAEINLLVYPDMSFELSFNGTVEQSYEYPYQAESAIREMLLSFQSETIEEDLYRESGSIILKLGPLYALFLANLDFDLNMQAEGSDSATTIQLAFPGMVDLDLVVETAFQEGTSEGMIDVVATATIWYSVLSEEMVNYYVLGFPLLKAEIESQLSDYSDGNLEFSELAIIESELGEISADITMQMTIEGDFEAGILSISENLPPDYIDPSAQPSTPLESWTISTRSAEAHIYFDPDDLSFNVEYEVVIEGDIDQQVNDLKDLYLEDLLDQTPLDPDAARLMYGLILPTEVSVVDLGVSLDMMLDEESSEIEFAVNGLGLTPPEPEALLSFLGEASEGAASDRVKLTLEGVTLGKEYVEIIVPTETTQPLSEAPQKVVWDFADLENLDKVTFEVKEKSSPLSSSLLIPAVGVVAVSAVAVWYFMSRKG